jgi:dephospho-CoA kinase
MKIVIGLSGKIGSGKGTVSAYLKDKYGAREHRFSDILTDILKRLHILPERRALQKMGASLRAQLGSDVLIKAFQKDLELDQNDFLVVDGIRYPNEVEMLRTFEKQILLFITAPPEVRFERVKERGEKGEEHISFEEFMQAEERETERHLDDISDNAEIIIDNSGSLAELYSQVEEALKGFGL